MDVVEMEGVGPTANIWLITSGALGPLRGKQAVPHVMLFGSHGLNQSIIAGTLIHRCAEPYPSFAVLPMCCHFGHCVSNVRFVHVPFPFPRSFAYCEPLAYRIPSVLS
jgi:hypothetical protein